MHASIKPSTSRNVAFGVLCVVSASSAANPALAASSSSISASGLHRRPSTFPHRLPATHTFLAIGKLRGGGVDDDDSSGIQNKKRKGKSSKKSAVLEESSEEATTSKKGGDAADEATDAKNAINDAMKETDAATALGDAIRDRATTLRRDRLPYSERTFDTALVSLGLSLGTAGTDKYVSVDGNGVGKVDTMAYYQYGHGNSIHPSSRNINGQNHQHGVQPSTSAVIANYFLKTHGGTHVIQCLLSLLASVLGMACLVLPSFPSSAGATGTASAAVANMNSKSISRKILLSTMKYQLMQQTLLLAMAKHASGLLGAVFLGASRIPQLGVRNARRHLELVALDPVGQYLFYCSLLVAWMGWFGGGNGTSMSDYMAGLKGSVISIMNASAATAATSSDASSGANSQDTAAVATQLLDTLSQNPPPWFLSQSYGGSIISILILGPILLREIVSVIWVFSDVLTLAFTSSGGMTGKLLSAMLSGCRSILDAAMSVLITSEKWRKADSFQRQRTLAKLVSQCSLTMELAVGGLLLGDAIYSFYSFAFIGSAGGDRLPFKFVLGKMACAHLYINYLLSRRRKIATVVGSIRGGAMFSRVLDVLIDPRKEMGLLDNDEL